MLRDGRLADIVVLDKDYMAMPENETAKLALQITIVSGKTVYVRKDISSATVLNPECVVVFTY